MAYLYRGPQSPRDESYSSHLSSNPLSPQRHPHRLSGGMVNAGDVRGNLTRRFTTNALPTLSPIGQQRLQAAGENTMPPGFARVVPSERKIRHIEGLLEQQRRINAELEQVDDETRREIEESLRHERALNQFIAQSEPTTPPEYQDSFPSSVARPNRYSASSLISPPGIAARPNRSSAHLASPSAGHVRPYTSHQASGFPSQSVPGSRRQSDDEEEDEELLFNYTSGPPRPAANRNRNSMPITSYDRKRTAADLSNALGPLNTTSFLFDDDENSSNHTKPSSTKTSPPDTKTFLQVQHTADGFPKLIRREENGDHPTPASSAALDLALGQTAIPEQQQVTDRVTPSRHRISLPPTALSSNGNIAPLNGILASSNEPKSSTNNRRSLEVKFSAETKRPALTATPPRSVGNGTPKAQPSYSTNDIPTLKSINDDPAKVNSTNSVNSANPTGNRASTTTNIGLPEYTAGPFSPNNAKNHNQDLKMNGNGQQDMSEMYISAQSGLQGNAVPFGPLHENQSQPQFTPGNMPYNHPAFYGGYGLQMLNNGFGNMNLNGSAFGAQSQWPNQISPYQQAGFGGYQQFQPRQAVSGPSRFPRAAATTNQPKPEPDELFNNIGVQQLHGQILSLCKDQHGCRFLQRKLEERKDQDVKLIFDEVKDHFTELMTDPFGNYLCQRLLEYSNNDQRFTLVQSAAPAMTTIALNQHGTRALQRMIEFVSTKEQTELLIEALRNDVVQLIQDLNGNHVIQKCLNHLSSEDAEFIFGAVGANCVTVGTHRHGCCVLQRCVDHASGLQKGRLVDHIIANAFALVQDPFGNYVVQYVLDLQEPCFTEPLCHNLLGNISFLSKQKFSSNVIEKCIRCADADTKRMLVREIAVPAELEKLLRDSFANYVVQTAMDYAPEDSKTLLIDNIRPILPGIRNTPHGRRISSKISDHDYPSNNLSPNGWPAGAVQIDPASQAAPVNSASSPSQIPVSRGNRMGMVGAPPQWIGGDGSNLGAFDAMGGISIASPPNQRSQPFQMLNSVQNYQNQGFQAQHFATAMSGNDNIMGGGAPYGHF